MNSNDGPTCGGPLCPPTLPLHEHYKIFRDYVEHEDELIANRLSWNITIQGFLFATYGLSIQKLTEVLTPHGTYGPVSRIPLELKSLQWLTIVLPVFGMLISGISFFGVQAAQNAIEGLNEIWARVPKPEGSPLLPELTGGATRQSSKIGSKQNPARGANQNHSKGFWAPKIFPLLFIAAWLALFVTYGARVVSANWYSGLKPNIDCKDTSSAPPKAHSPISKPSGSR